MCMPYLYAVKDVSSHPVKLPHIAAEMKIESCLENYSVLVEPQPELSFLAVVHCSFYFFCTKQEQNNKNLIINTICSYLKKSTLCQTS